MLKRSMFLAASAAATATVAFPTFARAAEDFAIPVAGGNLYGTLELPRAATPPPVVLIIAGSGPTDRDGNNPITGPNNAYKEIAAGLAARGIASLRYDKRGIAASKALRGDQHDLHFDMYVDDAVAIVAQLHADRRVGKITIAGHSEGSLIGMIAAARGNVASYVSLAGVGRPAETVILEQVARQMGPDDVTALKTIFDKIVLGQVVADVPSKFATLADPSLQPYLKSWFAYDPTVEIAKLRIPIAIVQGLTDLQVTALDARLLAKAAPTAKLMLVPHMNHVLKDTDAATIVEQLPVYRDPTLPLDAAVVDAIAASATAAT